jgi:hypothetical protein
VIDAQANIAINELQERLLVGVRGISSKSAKGGIQPPMGRHLLKLSLLAVTVTALLAVAVTVSVTVAVMFFLSLRLLAVATAIAGNHCRLLFRILSN